MTGAEWRLCDSPLLMLQHLEGRASERKARLFGAACCRRLWDQMDDERSRRAVELVERWADGGATAEEVEAMAEEADEAASDLGDGPSSAAWALTGGDAFESALMVHEITTGWVGELAEQIGGSEEDAEDAESAAHVALLHDIFDESVPRAVIDPAWQESSTVGTLARLIYEERLFEHMPELAEALEQAGCTDQKILFHCRSEIEHARGCWVVDALLGKS